MIEFFKQRSICRTCCYKQFFEIVVFLFLSILYFLERVYEIYSGYWQDETTDIWIIVDSATLQELFKRIWLHFFPPLDFIIRRIFFSSHSLGIFEVDEVSFALFSVAFSYAAFMYIYFSGVLTKREAILVCLLYAFSPLDIKYSAEARLYSHISAQSAFFAVFLYGMYSDNTRNTSRHRFIFLFLIFYLMNTNFMNIPIVLGGMMILLVKDFFAKNWLRFFTLSIGGLTTIVFSILLNYRYFSTLGTKSPYPEGIGYFQKIAIAAVSQVNHFSWYFEWTGIHWLAFIIGLVYLVFIQKKYADSLLIIFLYLLFISNAFLIKLNANLPIEWRYLIQHFGFALLIPLVIVKSFINKISKTIYLTIIASLLIFYYGINFPVTLYNSVSIKIQYIKKMGRNYSDRYKFAKSSIEFAQKKQIDTMVVLDTNCWGMGAPMLYYSKLIKHNLNVKFQTLHGDCEGNWLPKISQMPENSYVLVILDENEVLYKYKEVEKLIQEEGITHHQKFYFLSTESDKKNILLKKLGLLKK